MATTKEHIRSFIHFAFHPKKTATEATKIIRAVRGESTVSSCVKGGGQNSAKEISVSKMNRMLDALKRLKRATNIAG